MTPGKPQEPNAQSQFREMTPDEEAQSAFDCHRALMKARAADRDLNENPYFHQLILESYDRFLVAFGKC